MIFLNKELRLRIFYDLFRTIYSLLSGAYCRCLNSVDMCGCIGDCWILNPCDVAVSEKVFNGSLACLLVITMVSCPV